MSAAKATVLAISIVVIVPVVVVIFMLWEAKKADDAYREILRELTGDDSK